MDHSFSIFVAETVDQQDSRTTSNGRHGHADVESALAEVAAERSSLATGAPTSNLVGECAFVAVCLPYNWVGACRYGDIALTRLVRDVPGPVVVLADVVYVAVWPSCGEVVSAAPYHRMRADAKAQGTERSLRAKR